MSNLKTIRQHLNLRSEDMARAIGMSQTQYSRAERGEARLQYHNFMKLTKLVGEDAVLQSLMNEMNQKYRGAS